MLGVGIIAGIVVRRRPELWRAGLGGRCRARGVACRAYGRRRHRRRGLRWSARSSRVVLSAKPLLIDEIIQLYQARTFASGRLWLRRRSSPNSPASMHLLDWDGKVYGQFPAGGPAMLAIGVLLHAEWLVGPGRRAIGAYLFARLLRRIELRDGTALAALLLFAFAPFCLFLGGSMMNHVTETTWLLAAALGWRSRPPIRARPRVRRSPPGRAFGMAATIRPTDAAAFAMPAAAWLLWRARRHRRHVRALLLRQSACGRSMAPAAST